MDAVLFVVAIALLIISTMNADHEAIRLESPGLTHIGMLLECIVFVLAAIFLKQGKKDE